MSAKVLLFPLRRSSPIVAQPIPPIEEGHFHALRRTDGKFAVCDARRHPADRLIALVKGEKAARAYVRRLASA